MYIFNKKEKRELKITGLATSIVFADTLVFFLSWLFLSEHSLLHGSVSNKTYVSLFIAYVTVLLILNDAYDAYAIGRRRINENAYSLSLSCLISLFFFYFLDTLAFRRFYSIWYLIVAFVLQIVINYFWCKYANKKYYESFVAPKTLIIYRDKYDLEKVISIPYFKMKYNLKKKIENPKSFSEVNKELDKYEVVFVAGVKATLRNGIVKACVNRDIEAYVVPHAGDVIMAGSEYVQELPIPMVRVHRASPSVFYLFIKRVIDIVCSILAILVLWPFMLLTALAIKLYDGGPVIYSHIRLTKNGKEFYIYKFRSMKVDAEKDGVARLVSEKDDRITPIGKFIRMIRFDELPQLFNILKGDMTIVGPRPERPEIAKQYTEIYPSFKLRLQVKAGLTGYAQIYGKYNTEPIDKLKMDLYYINNMSVLFDIKLIFMTVKTLFMKESTAAIKEGTITASKDRDIE